MLQVAYCHFSYFLKFFHDNVHVCTMNYDGILMNDVEFLMSNPEYGAAGSVESNANIQQGS